MRFSTTFQAALCMLSATHAHVARRSPDLTLLPLATSLSSPFGHADHGLENAVTPNAIIRKATSPSPRQDSSSQSVSGTVSNGPPTTGQTRSYHFKVARSVIAPDGVDRPVILVNGLFPGPKIEANWGDMIQVTVENAIVGGNETEGTSIHWHGFRMSGTPYMDGVPSTSGCPIAPGDSFVYTFQADHWGSSFWHGHYGAQYSAGVFGPMVVHGPSSQTPQYDIDLGPVILTDWYHADYQTVVESVVGLPAPLTQAFSDNNLINGGNAYCPPSNGTSGSNSTAPTNGTAASCKPASYATFKFQQGKKHLLRIMNASSQGFQRFTIDGMNMTVVSNDFIPIKPYVTNVVSVGIGQRFDVVVEATGKATDSLWMRSDVSATCSVSHQPHALAPIYYQQANTSVLPTTNATKYDDSYCGNTPLNFSQPLQAMSPSAHPDTVLTLNMEFHANSSGNLLWWINNQTFRANYEQPTLLLAQAGNTTYPNPDWATYNMGSNNSVRIIMYNHVLVPRAQHPMHLHGHDFWIVAEGLGQWNGVANLNNPSRRDTFILQPGDPVKGPGFAVIDVNLDNPGVWPLHCHLAWHVSAGLLVNLMEHPEKIKNMTIPQSVNQTCKNWTQYKGVPVNPEIDSGL